MKEEGRRVEDAINEKLEELKKQEKAASVVSTSNQKAVVAKSL